jgi:hypothetical protein
MKHILITGTGRAGTTLLVQIFTALGLDTGYTLDDALDGVDRLARAGLEPNLQKHHFSQVVKAPGQAEHIKRLLQTEGFELEAAILPMRELFAAAESRRNVHRLALEAGKDPRKHPGSLWKTDDPTDQEIHLVFQFYQCLQPIVASRAPVHMLDFPSFAYDASYLFQTLQPIFGVRGISEHDVAAALDLVARPDLINNFSNRQAPGKRAAEFSYTSDELFKYANRRFLKFIRLR